MYREVFPRNFHLYTVDPLVRLEENFFIPNLIFYLKGVKHTHTCKLTDLANYWRQAQYGPILKIITIHYNFHSLFYFSYFLQSSKSYKSINLSIPLIPLSSNPYPNPPFAPNIPIPFVVKFPNSFPSHNMYYFPIPPLVLHRA